MGVLNSEGSPVLDPAEKRRHCSTLKIITFGDTILCFFDPSFGDLLAILDSSRSKSVWDRICILVSGPKKPGNLLDYAEGLSWKGAGGAARWWNALFIHSAWSIWKARNRVCFEDESFSPIAVAEHARQVTFEYLDANLHPDLSLQVCSGFRPPEVVATPTGGPPAMLISFDGGFVKEKQLGSAGFLVRDGNGYFLLAGWSSFPASSVFAAELRACWEALQKSRHLFRAHRVRIVGDSLSVVHSLLGLGAPSDMAKDCCFFLSEAIAWEALHIPRVRNGAAHALASCALKVGGSRVFALPPSFSSVLVEEGAGLRWGSWGVVVCSLLFF